MMLRFFSGTFRAAVRMQARWRGILARRHARAKLRAIRRAEGHGKRRLQQTLVRVFLGYKARKRARLLRRDRAIRRIQDFWRAIYWRRKLRFLRAISLFQAAWRRQKFQREVLGPLMERLRYEYDRKFRAAQAIQARARGLVVRGGTGVERTREWARRTSEEEHRIHNESAVSHTYGLPGNLIAAQLLCD